MTEADGPGSRSGELPVFEVPLTSDHSTGDHRVDDRRVDDRRPDDRPPESNRQPATRRRRLTVAAVVVAIGGVGAGALTLGQDDPTGSSATNAAIDDLAALITTPPTLIPLDTLPSADIGTADDPRPTTGQDGELFEVAQLPRYPEVTDASLADLVQYDVISAVERFADDVPRRSDTHLELGTAGFILDVVIERDPERDRYRITVESRDLSQVAIVDNATGTTYVDPDTDNVVTVPNEEIIAGSDAATVNEYFDRLLLGPLRPGTINPAATRGRGLVLIDNVRPARQFLTTIAGSLVPEWQLYAFSPVFEFRVEDRPSSLDYAVYVDEAGDVVQVDGLSLVGDVPQLVRHRVIRLDEIAPIEIPDVAPATPATAPATTPATTTAPPTATTAQVPTSVTPATTAPPTAPVPTTV